MGTLTSSAGEVQFAVAIDDVAQADTAILNFVSYQLNGNATLTLTAGQVITIVNTTGSDHSVTLNTSGTQSASITFTKVN